jgi:hypothetical protein
MRHVSVLSVTVAAILAACTEGRPPAPPRPTLRAASSGATAPTAAAPEATSEPTKPTPEEAARDAQLLPRARAVLAAFSSGGAYLTRAGAVVFASNRDGLAQLYVSDVARPKEAPRRLPGPREGIEEMTLTADERSVLFASDVGGDGNFSIFRVGIDGTDLRELTAGPKLHRDPPRVARANPDLFAFSGHAPSSEKTELFVAKMDGGEPVSVHADECGGQLLALSPDGKRALFLRYNSDADTVLFEVDVATKHATRIFPPADQPSSVAAAYSA